MSEKKQKIVFIFLHITTLVLLLLLFLEIRENKENDLISKCGWMTDVASIKELPQDTDISTLSNFQLERFDNCYKNLRNF